MISGCRERVRYRAAAAILALSIAATTASCTAPNPAYGRGDRDGALADAILFDTRPADVARPADVGRPPDAARPPDAPAAEASGWDLTTGLIGYWRLDEGRGGIARDASGHGHHGVLEGMDESAWVASPRGMALQIPDSQGAGVRVMASDAILGIEHFTIVAWVVRQPARASYQSLVSRQLGDTILEVFNLSLRSSDEVALLMSKSQEAGPGDWPYAARAAGGAPLDQWVHIAATFDGAVARLYVGGTEVATLDYPRALPKSGTPLYLGTNKNPVNNEPLAGRLDEVLLYGVALPPGAIAALARGAAPPAR